VRHTLLHGGHYLAVVAVCLAVAGPLARARWTWRAPRAAIVLWQLLALSLGSSLVGLWLAAGLAPYRTGELRGLVRLAATAATGLTPAHLAAVALGTGIAAGLAAVVAWQLLAVDRARRRHRARLSLVANPHPTDPELLLVDHPAPLAYCLPGRHRAVVVSAGTVGLLDGDQLAAVLAHEHAHTRERHDLVLLPFAALSRALPRSRSLARAYAAVALLVEMRADDLALRRHPADRLATALRIVGHAGGAPAVPAGGLGAAAGGQLRARLDRLAGSGGRRRPAVTVALALAGLALAGTVAATPLSLYLLP
jgi:Zn-dependent protease with chaperone function